MSAQDNGGPAFPCSHQNQMNGSPTEEMSGMTLRDYFAVHEPLDPNESIGTALAEQLVGSPLPRNEDGTYDALAVSKYWARAEAEYRYMRADAMLEARKQ